VVRFTAEVTLPSENDALDFNATLYKREVGQAALVDPSMVEMMSTSYRLHVKYTVAGSGVTQTNLIDALGIVVPSYPDSPQNTFSAVSGRRLSESGISELPWTVEADMQDEQEPAADAQSALANTSALAMQLILLTGSETRISLREQPHCKVTVETAVTYFQNTPIVSQALVLRGSLLNLNQGNVSVVITDIQVSTPAPERGQTPAPVVYDPNLLVRSAAVGWSILLPVMVIGWHAS
jgi:hypothetical protein